MPELAVKPPAGNGKHSANFSPSTAAGPMLGKNSAASRAFSSRIALWTSLAETGLSNVKARLSLTSLLLVASACRWSREKTTVIVSRNLQPTGRAMKRIPLSLVCLLSVQTEPYWIELAREGSTAWRIGR
ncbi:MAG: hypothetical protein GXY83_34360 [Rhodopirellula sp.]|nr:hypothetical protein [Rhodopirellula sp.]